MLTSLTVWQVTCHHPSCRPANRDVPKVLQCKVRVIPVPALKRGGGGTSIVTAFFRYGSHSRSSNASSGAAGSASAAAAVAAAAASNRLTLLYSHGNAVDLGHMLPVYRCGQRRTAGVCGWQAGGVGASRAGRRGQEAKHEGRAGRRRGMQGTGGLVGGCRGYSHVGYSAHQLAGRAAWCRMG